MTSSFSIVFLSMFFPGLLFVGNFDFLSTWLRLSFLPVESFLFFDFWK